MKFLPWFLCMLVYSIWEIKFMCLLKYISQHHGFHENLAGYRIVEPFSPCGLCVRERVSVLWADRTGLESKLWRLSAVWVQVASWTELVSPSLTTHVPQIYSCACLCVQITLEECKVPVGECGTKLVHSTWKLWMSPVTGMFLMSVF